jgi:TetR/AcrR family transcriptional regulator
MNRDLDATREALLSAAEAAFARHGYEGVSLQQIASAAGVSRGMPNYVFGSKADLYQAVLDRVFTTPQAMIAEFSAIAGKDLAQALTTLVGSYVDYLAARPAYVQLLQRAALDDGGDLGSGGNMAAVDAALTALGSLTTAEGARPFDARQLIVSVVALCFFPFAHQRTLLSPLGLDAHDPQFLAARKTHVVELLLRGLAGAHPAPTP